MKLGQSLAMLMFTSLATIGVAPFGYRLVALVASICCIVGGIIMTFFNEKKLMKTIGERSV
jgi:hypothetical protein